LVARYAGLQKEESDDCIEASERTMVNRSRFGLTMLTTTLALVGSCRRNGPIDAEHYEQDPWLEREDNESAARWTAWFDATFQQLPRAASSPVAPRDWVEVRASDGVRVRLGREYRRRNDGGCWATGREHWPGPGWRDICVFSVHPSRSVPSFHLEPRPLDPNVADQFEFDSWRVERVTFGNRRAIVERARASGGILGENRQRTMAVVIELHPGKWAGFFGKTGDDGGYDELLRVASTIEPPVP
jgi:hypothetical protein